MSNYSATVVRISNVLPHPNADRLSVTNIFGNTVIIGKDVQVGDTGIFFPLESQLSEEFCRANDLIRRKDASGKTVGGLFDENRRVRAQKLRGTPSMGFWIPITSLVFTGTNVREMEPGFEFQELNGIKICQKYIPRVTQTYGSGGGTRALIKRQSKIISGQFNFHFDTAQLGKNIHKISPGDLVAITWKLHGTSAIASNCLVKRNISMIDRIARWFGATIQESHHEMIYASRRVIKNEFMEDKKHYYSEDLWTRVGKAHFAGRLHTGETVYYEIVGFTGDGAFIQKGYDYKCAKGDCGIAVYRITQTAHDGTVTELQWPQVKQRATEIGVPHVPEIFYGRADELVQLSHSDHWHENILSWLRQNYVYDQDSQFCENKVPEEGICVRKEGLNIEVFKLKSFRFLEHETKELDNGVADTETQEAAV